jgi:hypothetical protein
MRAPSRCASLRGGRRDRGPCRRARTAADGVLERDEPRDGEVRVVGLDRRLDLGEVERAVGEVLQRLRLDRAQHRRPARLVAVGMRLLAHDDFLAALAMRHHRGEVRLRAGGKEEPRLHAEALGGDLVQAIDGGIVAEDVVADLGLGHGAAHGLGGLGDGVAAQVDQVFHSLGRAKSHAPRF